MLEHFKKSMSSTVVQLLTLRIIRRGDGNEVGAPVPSVLGLCGALWSSGLLKGTVGTGSHTGGRAEYKHALYKGGKHHVAHSVLEGN